jgi:crotonobetainyl-CoA:carnitine CoA-transferase CaiB-like acyl-CoA transferase
MQVTSVENNAGPLKGIKVLEISSMIAGPICGQALGDLGADVIKVEGVGGETARFLGPPFREGLSGFYAQYNRNKRSIAIDLKSDAGRQIVHDLVRDMDVVLENFRNGVLDKLGIGYDALKAINPSLIFVSISGFGPSGPYADLPAYDVLIQGMTGFMPVQGTDEEPQMIQTTVVDKSVGLNAVSCTLAALYSRDANNGAGQRVDVPMLDGFAQVVMPDLVSPYSFQPKEEFESTMPDLFRRFKTLDGYVVGLLLEDKQIEGLSRGLGCINLLEDDRFTTSLDRITNYDDYVVALEAIFADWETEKLIEIARANGVPLAPVYNIDQAMADPQVQHNGTVFSADDPKAGEAVYVRHCGHYEKSPASLRLHPPRLGEHTQDILNSLGYSEDRIQALREANSVA